MTLQDGTQLDPKVVKVMKAIRDVESGGKYDAVGDNGTSKGAYQWHGDNWKTAAKTVLGDENADMSAANQNKVAYYQIKEYKDQGLQPDEIAARWNGAKIDKVTGKYTYINPEYGQKFHKALGANQNIQGNSGYNTTAALPTPSGTPQQPQEKGLISNVASDISNRTGEFAGALSDIPAALQGKGKQNVSSDVIQGAGAVGGLVGDVTSHALEATPVVGTAIKGIEGLIGQGVGALASTDTGKAVISSVTQWAKDHPELAKDIGAGFNIVTAIPILRGLGMIKNVALDAAATALKGVAEKGALKDLTATVMRSKAGEKALSRSPEGIKTLIDERALPDIEGGKYTIQEANSRLEHEISRIDDTELEPALAKGNVSQVSNRIPLSQLKDEATQNAIEGLKDTAPIEKYFERLKAKYGDYLTLQQVNEAKRLVARNISEAGFNSPTYTTDKVVRAALQKGVEDGAAALGLGDVAAINQKMARLFKAQDILEQLDRKPVKMGHVSGLIRDAAMVGGETVGNATGIPLAGAYMGREFGGRVGNGLVGLRTGLLNRTGKKAVKTPLKKAASVAGKGLIATGAQRATKNP